jgi:hypothetical protein
VRYTRSPEILDARAATIWSKLNVPSFHEVINA